MHLTNLPDLFRPDSEFSRCDPDTKLLVTIVLLYSLIEQDVLIPEAALRGLSGLSEFRFSSSYAVLREVFCYDPNDGGGVHIDCVGDSVDP